MNESSWIASEVNVLINLANNLIPVERLVTGAAYVIGLLFVMKALLTLKAHSESHGSAMSSGGGLKEPLVYFFVAGVFIFFPSAFEIFMNSTFGYSNVLAYAPLNSQSPMLDSLFGADSLIGAALTIIIQVVGVISFVRGWILIAKSASQGQPPNGTGKGLMHVFGGILAINIVGTLQIINNTLYGAG